MSYNFSVEFKVNTHLLLVKGMTSPVIKAKTNCANEDSTPAEGGELEDLEVFLTRRVIRPRQRGGSQSMGARRLRRKRRPYWMKRKLPEALVESLELDEQIYKALAKE